MNKNVVIVDYGLGNLFSVGQALKNLGIQAKITDSKDHIARADAIILPGVGAFGKAMENLRNKDLVSPLLDKINEGKPFLGICLGLQLLFEESEEFGVHKGLGFIQGQVKRIPSKHKNQTLRVPQIAWNKIYSTDQLKWEDTILRDVYQGSYVYFVHSYYVEPSDSKVVLTNTNYNNFEYCSSITKGNVTAFQFHPEKSAQVGSQIFKNWISTF